MLNRDDLSDVAHRLEKEYIESGQKKFAINHIATYDELTFQIVQRYLTKFNKWVAEATNKQAEILYKRVNIAKEDHTREALTDKEYRETVWTDEYHLYMIWTGPLPPTR